MFADQASITGIAPLDEAAAVRCIEAPPSRGSADLTVIPFEGAWPEAVKRFSKRTPVKRVFAWDLSGCTVFPPYMILVTAEGQVARQSIRKPILLRSMPAFSSWGKDDLTQLMWGRGADNVGAALPPDLSMVDEPCVLLGSAQGFNYYHWMVELLPKLGLVREEMAAGRRLVVPGFCSAFQPDSLRYFGLNPDACIALARPTRFRDLRFLSNIVFNATALSSFVDAFFRQYEGRGGRRLYVSRADADRRRVVNERDLGCLADFGFEHVTASSLSFADQAETFRSAEIVVGAHGAALANTAFMRSGTHVVELVPDSIGGLTCYAALSEERGLAHTILLCPSLGEGANADFEVRENDLAGILQSIKPGRRSAFRPLKEPLANRRQESG